MTDSMEQDVKDFLGTCAYCDGYTAKDSHMFGMIPWCGELDTKLEMETKGLKQPSDCPMVKGG